mmetsp:Transcript_35054/g.58991  ORF Transcript_35054/g.58991 Transcript_35054/m.58991 type:complete len:168 (-) Transcript_35054:605-1108(-)
MGGGLKKKQKKLDAIAKGKPATKRKHEEPDDGKVAQELEEDYAQDPQVTARRRSGIAEGEERPSKKVLKRRGEQARAKSKLANSATPRATTTANPFADEFKKVVPAQLEERLKKLLKARGVQPTHKERRMKEAIKAELTAQREAKKNSWETQMKKKRKTQDPEGEDA